MLQLTQSYILPLRYSLYARKIKNIPKARNIIPISILIVPRCPFNIAEKRSEVVPKSANRNMINNGSTNNKLYNKRYDKAFSLRFVVFKTKIMVGRYILATQTASRTETKNPVIKALRTRPRRCFLKVPSWGLL